ncbi:hypothetical protein BHE74_00050958 [Ensete ventricosum]|nr:hypothetical protein BHE74_00050958 [Ensete ventricosum]
MIRITGSIEREARVVLWSPRDLKSAISLNRVACPLSVCSGTRHVDRYQAPAHFKSMRELDGRPFKIATSIRRRIIAETHECPSRHAGGGRVRPHDVPTSLFRMPNHLPLLGSPPSMVRYRSVPLKWNGWICGGVVGNRISDGLLWNFVGGRQEMQTPLIAGEGSSSSGAGGWRGGAYQRRKSVPRRSDALTYGDNYQKAAALVDLVLPSFLPLIFIVYLV